MIFVFFHLTFLSARHNIRSPWLLEHMSTTNGSVVSRFKLWLGQACFVVHVVDKWSHARFYSYGNIVSNLWRMA